MLNFWYFEREIGVLYLVEHFATKIVRFCHVPTYGSISNNNRNIDLSRLKLIIMIRKKPDCFQCTFWVRLIYLTSIHFRNILISHILVVTVMPSKSRLSPSHVPVMSFSQLRFEILILNIVVSLWSVPFCSLLLRFNGLIENFWIDIVLES